MDNRPLLIERDVAALLEHGLNPPAAAPQAPADAEQTPVPVTETQAEETVAAASAGAEEQPL